MILFAFFLSTLFALWQGILFPKMALFAYAPFLALCLIELPFKKNLWIAALTGLFFDLLSDHPFGAHALVFSLSSFFLFRIRRSFSSESPLHLFVYTALFSFATTLFLFAALFLFDRRIPFAGRWYLLDLFMMPIFDGIYALIWFSAPLFFFRKLQRYWVLFWVKRKKLSLN